MTTTGSRFSGGYQFMASDHATLRRGKPLRVEGPIGKHHAMVELIPLDGTRAETFDVSVSWTTTDAEGRPQAGVAANLAHSAEEAHRAFAATVEHLRDGGDPGAPR